MRQDFLSIGKTSVFNNAYSKNTPFQNLASSPKKTNMYQESRMAIKSRQSQRNKLKISEHPIGLRNIGNTCFLNSIIQFLYGAEKMRNILIKSYGQQKNLVGAKVSKLLGKLFYYLQQKSQEKKEIYQVLSLLADHIQLLNSQYRKYSQEDALQTLLNILIQIEEKHPNAIELFDVQQKFHCKCAQYKTIERVLSYRQNSCAKCKSVFKIFLTNQPYYIIYSNPSKEPVKQEKIQEFHETKLNITYFYKITYSLKAQITYNGNGRSGHYVAKRLDQNTFFSFNDDLVLKQQEITHRNVYTTRLILLYQFKKKQQVGKNYTYNSKNNQQSFDKNDQIKKIESQAIKNKQKDNKIQKGHQNSKIYKKEVEVQDKHLTNKSILVDEKAKIQFNKIYKMVLSVPETLQVNPTTYEKRDVFLRINNKNKYSIQLLNKDNFPYYRTDSKFSEFYLQKICGYKNQMELFQKYISSYLKQCESKYNRQSNGGRQFQIDNKIAKKSYNMPYSLQYQSKIKFQKSLKE